MSRHVLPAILLVMTALAARADDDAAARAVIDKAIDAHGGDKLVKLAAVSVKFKATFHGMGQAIPMSGDVITHGHDRQKVDVEVEAGGLKIRFVQVLNGDKGWKRIGEDTKELGKDELAEAREQAYAEWLATLAPLRNQKTFNLQSIGEVAVDKRPTLAVKVSSKGHRDVNLYFDKDTGRLVKSETRVKDDNGQEVTQEAVVWDYKEVQGTKQAMKFTIKRDGKLYMEGETTECQLAESLDASVFGRP
jgi:hypothetical protein